MFLSDEVRLDKTVTFETLFKLIMAHADLFNIIYAQGTLGNYTIEQYSEEFFKFDDDEDPDSYMRKSGISKFEEYLQHNRKDLILFKTSLFAEEAKKMLIEKIDEAIYVWR